MAEHVPTYEEDPANQEAAAQREKRHGQLERAYAIRRRKDFSKRLSGEVGRRTLRLELAMAGFHVDQEYVESIFDRHYGAMCMAEGRRIEAIQTIWLMLLMVAHGELSPRDLNKLITETDSDG